jgi:hypothetical protein
MINGNFEIITNLQYKVKALTGRVKAFESGEKYVAMQSEFRGGLNGKDREIKKLKRELAAANCRTVTVRNNWQQVFEDVEAEHKKELKAKRREIEALEKQLFKTQDALTATQEKLQEKGKELYRVMSELEEEKGKNQKLKNQINRDHENSSIPSSMELGRKKIFNNREKTDRKPGGQPGHKGHGRKKLTPTNIINIPAPEEYAGNPEYRPTGRTIKKQIINIRVDLIVDEYNTPEFRNIRTGRRVHAGFPGGVVNDVNYGGSIKGLAFLLNNNCFVSIDKVRGLISELTDGQLKISKGMINGLGKEFSRKTEAEQKSIFCDLLLSPVMNTDFTSARLNGKSVQALVCANAGKVIYFAREHKGHEGVKGTPVEDYQGILVHDHDKTFYNYGGGHQECLSHPLRYLKSSMENEPGLSWNIDMRSLIQEMIHYRNSIDPGADINPDKVKEFEDRYLEILAVAGEEYEYEPPGDYYRDGYNLYKRLYEYMDCHLLFLHDKRVPATNNLSERLLRIFKRKQKQVMAFRSFDNIRYLCDSLSIIESMRAQNQNLYKSVASFFD